MRENGYLCMSCWALCKDKTAEWISFRWFISFPHWAHRLSNPTAKYWRTLCFASLSLVMVMKHKLGSPSKWLAVIKLSQPEGTFTGGNLGRRRPGTYSSTPKTQVNGTSPVIAAWASFLALSKQFLQHSSQLRAGEWSAHTCPHLWNTRGHHHQRLRKGNEKWSLSPLCWLELQCIFPTCLCQELRSPCWHE